MVLNVILILALYSILFSFCFSVSLIQIKSIIKSFNLFYNTFYLFADFDFTNNFYLYYNAQVLSYAQDASARKVISVIIPNEPKTRCINSNNIFVSFELRDASGENIIAYIYCGKLFF